MTDNITLRKAAQQALEALENHEGNYKLGRAGSERQEAAINAIKEALAQPPLPVQPEQDFKTATKEDAALKQVIDLIQPVAALADGTPFEHSEVIQRCVDAVEIALEALAQPVQEPVTWEMEPLEYWNAVEGWVKIDELRKHFDSVGCGTIYKTAGEDRVPLYTTPPQRPWVGLTDEEMSDIVADIDADFGDLLWKVVCLTKIIQAELKERNA